MQGFQSEDDEDDEVYSNLLLLHEYYKGGSQTGLTKDYIGPAIDTGFRLAQLSTPRRLVVSVELALMLVHAVRTQPADDEYGYEKVRFFFDGRHSFKGVFGGLPYPVFWIDMRASPALEDSEDKLKNLQPLGTDNVLAFCQQFIKENASYCFTPYILGNSDPAFDRVPSHHQERLEGLKAYWEKERQKRALEVEAAMQPDNESEATARDQETLTKLAEYLRIATPPARDEQQQ